MYPCSRTSTPPTASVVSNSRSAATNFAAVAVLPVPDAGSAPARARAARRSWSDCQRRLEGQPVPDPVEPVHQHVDVGRGRAGGHLLGQRVEDQAEALLVGGLLLRGGRALQEPAQRARVERLDRAGRRAAPAGRGARSGSGCRSARTGPTSVRARRSARQRRAVRGLGGGDLRQPEHGSLPQLLAHRARRGRRVPRAARRAARSAAAGAAARSRTRPARRRARSGSGTVSRRPRPRRAPR